MGRVASYFCIALIFASCAREPERNEIPTFKDYYQSLTAVKPKGQTTEIRRKLITITAQDMQLHEFLRWLADEAGISVIAAENLRNRTVSIEATMQDAKSILSAVARSIDAQTTQIGSMFFIGDLLPEDKALLVQKVPRLSPDEITSMAETFLSQFGKLAVTTDGILVVADKVEVLTRINSLLSSLARIPSNSWCIQLYIVSMGSSAMREIGIDVSQNVDWSVGVTDQTRFSQGIASLRSILKFAVEYEDSSIIAEPMILAVDGETAVFRVGQRVPIPNDTINDEGTIVSRDFEYVDTGLNISLALREMAQTLRLGLDLELSQIGSFPDGGAPIIAQENINTTAFIQSGGVYLVGSLERHNYQKQDRGLLLPSLRNTQQSNSTLMVWCRAFKIGGQTVLDTVAQ